MITGTAERMVTLKISENRRKVMKYGIVYSSQTGNTRKLAEGLKEELARICRPEGTSCIYFGEPEGADEHMLEEGELWFAGFWTDKGDCDEKTAAFLERLHGKQVFLFGTAGFGESQEYFSRILSRVKEHLEETNICNGSFMCQGKMPESVRRRYEMMKEKDPERMEMLIRNFDQALSHPDDQDMEGLFQAAERFILTQKKESAIVK